MEWDVVIVGARCAGASLALQLARAGHRVLVVDKASFPSDTMSTLYLHPPAIALLSAWGLLDEVARSGCPPIQRWRWHQAGEVLEGFPWSPSGEARSYAPRRHVLDTILVEAARGAGAEVRERFRFEAVVRDGDRVVGIRGRARDDDAMVEESARVVIGADGMRSSVAAAVGAEIVLERPALNCGYYAFFSAWPVDAIEVWIGDGTSVVTLPTNEGRTLVWAGWPVGEYARVKANLEAAFGDALTTVPGLGERVRSARREEPFVGSGDLRNFFRRCAGPGWALVGDAGYHKDPITAQGISDALRHATLLAEHLDGALGGSKPIDDALAAYERARDEVARPMFDWTCRVAEMKPTSPRLAMLLRALARSRRETDQFFGLNAGTVSPAAFFEPANLARIVTAAAEAG